MRPQPRLRVVDAWGERLVDVDKPVFTIGRRPSADLQVANPDISREHARITCEADDYLIADWGSRYGTFVNDERVAAPRVLVHGDRIRLGQNDAVQLVFLAVEDVTKDLQELGTDVSDLRRMTAVLNVLRALGSGGVLDEVLALVVDSALDMTFAERGFVMLESATGELELRTSREAGHRPPAGPSYPTSQTIPHEVFRTGQSQIVPDLSAESLAGEHDATLEAGILQVLCVPLRVVPLATMPSLRVEEHVIGVLYLDSSQRGKLPSSVTRASLEAFGMQAALAIESVRLYAESAERAKLERDLRMAAEIQRALLPEPRWRAPTFDVAGASVPCRTIGGDFFDYFDLPGGDFAFALGDVAGKGPPAALLAATVQSHFAAQAPVADHAADMMFRLNRALLRRAVEARFATMFYGVLAPEGRLHYCNAGHEHPVVVRAGGAIDSLDVGGPVLGVLARAAYHHTVQTLHPGDLVLVWSDGVTEACNVHGEEYGRDRLIATLVPQHGEDPEAVLEVLLDSVRAFVGSEPQADDITALVLRYRGR